MKQFTTNQLNGEEYWIYRQLERWENDVEAFCAGGVSGDFCFLDNTGETTAMDDRIFVERFGSAVVGAVLLRLVLSYQYMHGHSGYNL